MSTSRTRPPGAHKTPRRATYASKHTSTLVGALCLTKRSSSTASTASLSCRGRKIRCNGVIKSPSCRFLYGHLGPYNR
eukprot:1180638-Prorocentrum_minimum.AAC.7